MKVCKEKCKIYDIGILFISMFVILLFLNYNKRLKEERKNEYLRKQEIQLKNFSEFYLEEYKKNIENQFEYLFQKIEYEKLSDNNYRETLLRDWDVYRINNPYIKWIYVAYPNNTIIIDKTWTKPEGYQVKEWSWYQEGIRTNGLVWSKPYEDNVTKKVYVALTKPLKNKKGEVKALFGADLDLERLSDVVSSFDINQENFIYDENFRIVAHTNQSLLNKDVKDAVIVKSIELSKKNHVYDEKANAYIYYKNELGWTLVKKIPRSILIDIEKRINKDRYIYISIYFILVTLLHFLYFMKQKHQSSALFKSLRALQNRENIGVPFVRNKLNENIFQEISNIQSIIVNLEKETYRDEETGLYSKNYFDSYMEEFIRTDKRILIIHYKNLNEIRNHHGKSVVDLVLNRGAMTLNGLKDVDEVALRIDKETLGIVLNSSEAEKKSNYIISEILNYKWKMHNIYLQLSWDIMTIEEFERKLSGFERS